MALRSPAGRSVQVTTDQRTRHLKYDIPAIQEALKNSVTRLPTRQAVRQFRVDGMAGNANPSPQEQNDWSSKTKAVFGLTSPQIMGYFTYVFELPDKKGHLLCLCAFHAPFL